MCSNGCMADSFPGFDNPPLADHPSPRAHDGGVRAAGRPRPRHYRFRRRVVLSVTLPLALFVAGTLRILVFPMVDPPGQADAIFMLGGPGDRLSRAVALAGEGYAPVLVVSTPGGRGCPIGQVPRTKLICFQPEPVTTQGEAREVGRLARQHGWKKVIFVVERSQDTRARLRIGRCYDGESLVTVVNPPWHEWPYLIAYQWGAMAKALVWQRDC